MKVALKSNKTNFYRGEQLLHYLNSELLLEYLGSSYLFANSRHAAILLIDVCN